MKDDEVFICSDRSALNMSFQGLTKVPEKVEKITDVAGSLLLGLPLKAPLSVY
jgi:leucyl-tRNA synthetase